jgi:ATP-binding cassette subfamily B protein
MAKSAEALGGQLLLTFIRPHWPLAAGAVAVLLAAAVGTLALLNSAGWFIDRLLASGPDGVRRAGAVYFAGLTLVALLSAARFALISSFGERVANDLRRALFKRLLGFEFTFFETRRPGELAAQVSGDVAVVQSALGSTVSVAVRNLVILVGGTILLLKGFALLVVVVLAAALAATVPLHIWGGRVRAASRRAQEALGEAAGRLTEAVTGIETVKAFRQEHQEYRRFAAVLDTAERSALSQVLHRSVMNALLILLLFGGLGVVVLAAALQADRGAFARAEMASFVALAVGVASAAAALGDMYGELQKARGAADRLAALIFRPALPTDAPSAAPLPDPQPGHGPGPGSAVGLRLSGISFAYPSRPGHAALQDIDLEVRPGERLALVGPSGAGKSTLFKLLLGLYAPDRGTIAYLRAEDGAEEPLAWHPGWLGVVPQDVIIFADSAYDNIAFAAPEASPDDVRDAARTAQAHAFIELLPQGYATQLGPRGVRLSGGQRQRIAIARAALRNAPILLLDEATSSLDAESERAVFDALAALLAGRTSLTIAHRLSTVIDADRIVVLDGGRIADVGTHAELLARCSLYERLTRLQLGRSPDADGELSAAPIARPLAPAAE